MERIKLSFRAQSLDNTSDDKIVKDGKVLDASEEMERQKVVSRIYRVVSNKTEVLSEPNITIYRRESDFVVEAVPDKRDSIDRGAPIVIYGKLPQEWSEDWGSHVRSQIKDFAKNINRTLDDKALDAIEAGLEDAYKKKQRTESLKNLLMHLGIAVTMPLLLGWILQQQVPLLVQQQVTKPSPQQVTKPSPQQVTPTIPQPVQPQVTLVSLQQVIQTLIMQIAGLIAINNTLMLILPKLSIASLLNRQDRMEN